MIGNSSQVNLLSNLLRQAEQRHKVVSHNIANVNTPGFKSLEASFAQLTTEQLKDDQTVVKSGDARITTTQGLIEREDGNNGDLDREMGNLTRNSLEFETFSHLLVARISQIRSAIAGQ